jgi:hypothetical protein
MCIKTTIYKNQRTKTQMNINIQKRPDWIGFDDVENSWESIRRYDDGTKPVEPSSFCIRVQPSPWSSSNISTHSPRYIDAAFAYWLPLIPWPRDVYI